jgi:hypothetical protein
VELAELGVREELAEQNQRMEYLHNPPKAPIALRMEEHLRHNYHHHLTISIQTGQIQTHLHHPATGVVEVIAEEEDLAGVAEEAVAAAEEDNV